MFAGYLMKNYYQEIDKYGIWPLGTVTSTYASSLKKLCNARMRPRSDVLMPGHNRQHEHRQHGEGDHIILQNKKESQQSQKSKRNKTAYGHVDLLGFVYGSIDQLYGIKRRFR